VTLLSCPLAQFVVLPVARMLAGVLAGAIWTSLQASRS
jgi:hypothetical protein